MSSIELFKHSAHIYIFKPQFKPKMELILIAEKLDGNALSFKNSDGHGNAIYVTSHLL